MRGDVMQIHQLGHAGKLHAAFPQARVCRLQKAALWGSAGGVVGASYIRQSIPK
jgi:hypothetical protein